MPREFSEEEDISTPLSNNHALLCGEVMGSCMAHGLDIEPMFVGDDYAACFRIHRPSGVYRVTIIPEPV